LVQINSAEGTKLSGIASGADVTLSAVNGGLTVTGGGITLSSGGAIKGGQTAYNTGTGFFQGWNGSAYVLSLGNPAGNKLTWDGTSLAITGAITLTNTIASGSITGLAATATSSDFASVTGATKPANNADVTLSAVNGGLTVTGGGITLSGGGSIKGGQTAYDSGTGFFLGFSGAAYKFSIGNSSGNKLTWDGSTLGVVGAITGTSSIAITGSASFDGSTSAGSALWAVAANASFVQAGGVYAAGNSIGVLGNTITGTGVYGTTVSGTGVKAEATGAGTALSVLGPMTTSNSTLVTNLNAEKLSGNLAANFVLYTGTVDTGNPGTPTHAIHCILGSTAFRIPVLIP
jgi:hypothetical protein